MLNKLMLVFCLICVSYCFLQAQKGAEIGAFVGIANYQGDLSEAAIELGETRFAVGLLARKHFNPKWSIRANVMLGRIAGSDERADDEGRRIRRNWEFEGTLFEVSGVLEWSPFRRPLYSATNIYQPQLNPFLLVGIGYTHAISDVDTSDSPNLNISGVGGNNDLLVFPVGVGLRYDFEEDFAVSGEITWRYSPSDDLDGIQTSVEENADWYVFAGISLTKAFGKARK